MNDYELFRKSILKHWNSAVKDSSNFYHLAIEMVKNLNIFNNREFSTPFGASR